MIEAAPELAALAAFAIMCFLVGAYYAYGYTFGAMLEWIVAKIKSLPSINLRVTTLSFDFLAVPFETVDNAIRHALGAGINATRSAGLYMWHWSAYLADELGKALEALAATTERALRHALHIHIPAFVNNRLLWLTRQIHLLQSQIESLPHRAEIVIHKPVQVIYKEAHAAKAAVADVTIGAIRPIQNEIDTLQRQTKALYKKLTIAGIIALIGATIFREFNLGWLRCKGVGRIGRSLCGMSGLIETLYADAITAFAVTDLCRFSYGVERTAEAIRPLMLDWVDVEHALIHCSSADYPDDVPRFLSSPTPVYAPIAI